jgi:hypothetical protein
MIYPLGILVFLFNLLIDNKIRSWFHNFELSIENMTIFGLDWVSRYPAIRELGYKGAMVFLYIFNNIANSNVTQFWYLFI